MVHSLVKPVLKDSRRPDFVGFSGDFLSFYLAHFQIFLYVRVVPIRIPSAVDTNRVMERR